MRQHCQGGIGGRERWEGEKGRVDRSVQEMEDLLSEIYCYV